MTIRQLKEILDNLGTAGPILDAEIFVRTHGRADSGDHMFPVSEISLKHTGFYDVGRGLVFEADDGEL